MTAASSRSSVGSTPQRRAIARSVSRVPPCRPTIRSGKLAPISRQNDSAGTPSAAAVAVNDARRPASAPGSVRVPKKSKTIARTAP